MPTGTIASPQEKRLFEFDWGKWDKIKPSDITMKTAAAGTIGGIFANGYPAYASGGIHALAYSLPAIAYGGLAGFAIGGLLGLGTYGLYRLGRRFYKMLDVLG